MIVNFFDSYFVLLACLRRGYLLAKDNSIEAVFSDKLATLGFLKKLNTISEKPTSCKVYTIQDQGKKLVQEKLYSWLLDKPVYAVAPALVPSDIIHVIKELPNLPELQTVVKHPHTVLPKGVYCFVDSAIRNGTVLVRICEQNAPNKVYTVFSYAARECLFLSLDRTSTSLLEYKKRFLTYEPDFSVLNKVFNPLEIVAVVQKIREENLDREEMLLRA